MTAAIPGHREPVLGDVSLGRMDGDASSPRVLGSVLWGRGECVIQVPVQVGALRIVRGKEVRVLEMACFASLVGEAVNLLQHPPPPHPEAKLD